MKWMKEERNGGRKDRRIELGEICGRGMEEIRGEMMNTEVKMNHRVTQIYQKQLVLSSLTPFVLYK